MSKECKYARPVMIDEGYKVGLYVCSKLDGCKDQYVFCGENRCYLMLEKYHIERLKGNVSGIDPQNSAGGKGFSTPLFPLPPVSFLEMLADRLVMDGGYNDVEAGRE